MTDFKAIISELLNNDNIVIYPHVNIDGDALGASQAICLALRKLGKNAWILYKDVIPNNLDYLTDSIVDDVSFIEDIGVSFQIDSTGYSRIDGRETEFDRGLVKLCIDHHEIASKDIQYDHYYCEPHSAATGEIAYSLIKELGVNIDIDIANAIFTAITTDTGNFQHSNTSARSHDIVSELYEVTGFNSKPVSSLIYDRKPKNIVKLECMVLGNIDYYADGRVAVGIITKDILDETGAELANVDVLVSSILAIEGVLVSALIKEAEDYTKVSLRSLEDISVAEVAQKFDGGGHTNAAGLRSKLNPLELRDKLVPVLIEAVQ